MIQKTPKDANTRGTTIKKGKEVISRKVDVEVTAGGRRWGAVTGKGGRGILGIWQSSVFPQSWCMDAYLTRIHYTIHSNLVHFCKVVVFH